MYFFSINKLKDDIKAGRFTDKDAFYYYIVYSSTQYILLSVVFFGLSFPKLIKEILDFKAIPNIWDWGGDIAYFIVFILGNVSIYIFNNGANGKDFLNRLFSISFVVAIRFIPIFIAVLLFMFFIEDLFFIPPHTQNNENIYVPTNAFIAIVPILFIAVYYATVCKHIKDVASTE